MHTDQQTNDRRTHKHSVYMPPVTWDLANSTARSLGLSTSQLLSRLVLEAAPLIRPHSLLGLRRTDETPEKKHAA
jgi:hypothetical protein